MDFAMSETEMRREEVRGLFALGLVAITVTLRYASGLPSTISSGFFSNIPILSILDGVILTWGLYAFFMVFAFSGDFLPKSLSDMFRNLARFCLILSLVFLTFAAALVGVVNMGISVWIIAAAVLVVAVSKAVETYRKNKSPSKAPSLELSSSKPASNPGEVPACVQLLDEFRERARRRI
jgi:type IV secretory pathway TraG/TraD family ATPase VirD4